MREARKRLSLSDAEIVDSFFKLGMTVAFKELAFTPESLEDYRWARSNHWSGPGRLVVDEPSLLVVEKVRPEPQRHLRDVVVADFGPSRVVVGTEVKDRNRTRFARALA